MKSFECKMCGDCCYGEGGIFLSEREVKRIARFLGLSKEDFTGVYCIQKDDQFAIKSHANKYCIFYKEEKQCLIHPVKPQICTRWPFYPSLLNDEDTWKAAQDACPGINPKSSFEDFLRESEAVTNHRQ